MNFFVDNNLPPALAGALHGYLDKRKEGKAVHLRDKFKPDISDKEWIQHLADDEEEWIVLSGDMKIIKNKGEQEAWKQASLKGFFIDKSFRQHKQYIIVSKVFNLLECMEKKIEDSGSKPFQVRLPVSGQKLKDL